MSTRHQCECGAEINMSSLKKHLTTQKHLKGAGLMDMVKSGVNWVKDKFSKRIGFNNISTKTLNTYGNMKIEKIVVAKEPIAGMLDTIINFVSLGKWTDLKKKYGYDKLMHLGLIITVKLESGGTKDIMVEKVDAVTVSPNIRMNGSKVQTMNVNVTPNQYTLEEVLNIARRGVGDQTFFDYNPFKNNCQYFCSYILKACKSYSQQVRAFVFQDVTELAKEMPSYAKTIMQATTDLGQIANHVRGAGELHIQAVHVRKRVPLEEAKQHAQNIIKNKRKRKVKVLKNWYHFRNENKNKFDKDTFVTKKVNKDINIIMGKLKEGLKTV